MLQWAKRVSPAKIRQVYNLDAQGIMDEELIDDVAYAFYARCESILKVTEASRGRVKCPECGCVILRHGVDKEQIIKCQDCSWEITWGEYFRSYHQKQLHGGGAVDVFKDFMAKLPLAKTPQEKMILIDRIIHECHKSIKEGEYNRPAAVNLISGTMIETIRLLEELAYGPGSIPSSGEVYEVWREKMDDAIKRWGIKED
jgi:hypothetical protein